MWSLTILHQLGTTSVMLSAKLHFFLYWWGHWPSCLSLAPPLWCSLLSFIFIYWWGHWPSCLSLVSHQQLSLPSSGLTLMRWLEMSSPINVENDRTSFCLSWSQAIHSCEQPQGSAFLCARPFVLPLQGQSCSDFGEFHSFNCMAAVEVSQGHVEVSIPLVHSLYCKYTCNLSYD